MQLQTIIFHGRSGCGKGTQIKLLAGFLAQKEPERKSLVVETGSLFRKFIEGNSYTSRLTKETLAVGGLPPEFLPVWLWAGHLVEEYTGVEHLLFDGFPRRPPEAAVLDGAITFYKREQPVLLMLNVSKEWARERLMSRGRYDDKTEAQIDQRLAWYETEVVPALNYFRERSVYRVLEVNGEQPIEKVHQDVLTALGLVS